MYYSFAWYCLPVINPILPPQLTVFCVVYLFSNDNFVLCRRHHDGSHLTSHLWRKHLLPYNICMYVCMPVCMYACIYIYIYIFIYIFLFVNTWLIAWHVSCLDYMGGPYKSGSHCNQCKDLPTFSTVFFMFALLYYCNLLCAILSNKLFSISSSRHTVHCSATHQLDPCTTISMLPTLNA